MHDVTSLRKLSSQPAEYHAFLNVLLDEQEEEDYRKDVNHRRGQEGSLILRGKARAMKVPSNRLGSFRNMVGIM